jgi:DNA-binding beta-propeller fold protein YncE
VSLVRTDFVPVPPGSAPGFDHADVHLGSRRLYVAHTGADRVDVIDCEELAFVRSLEGHPGVAGVLVDDAHDLLVTSDRGAARVSVYRCSDEELLGRVEVGPRPNGLAYDRRRRRVYAFCLGEPIGEGCTASVVELGSMSVVADVELSGRPRWAVYDDVRDVVYANISAPAEIAVVDAATLTIGAAIEVPSDGPHGLWLDAGRLFCAADGGALVVFDVVDGVDGSLRARLPLPGAPDVVMHDAELGRLYVAVGDPGLVCSFDSRRLSLVETIETEPGAHTTGWDPVAKRLYVFCPVSCGATIYEERD